MEFVNESELKRYALIDHQDIIFWDSDEAYVCCVIMEMWGKENFKGVYDYERNTYFDDLEITNILDSQLQSVMPEDYNPIYYPTNDDIEPYCEWFPWAYEREEYMKMCNALEATEK